MPGRRDAWFGSIYRGRSRKRFWRMNSTREDRAWEAGNCSPCSGNGSVRNCRGFRVRRCPGKTGTQKQTWCVAFMWAWHRNIGEGLRYDGIFLQNLRTAGAVADPLSEAVPETAGEAEVKIVFGRMPDFLLEAGQKGYGTWTNGFVSAWFRIRDGTQVYVEGAVGSPWSFRRNRNCL